jgi:hypothetical protein
MLCEFWGFQGDDYEEYLLLGFKNLVRTSQETRLRYKVQPVNAM